MPERRFEYRVYGHLASREAASLASVLVAKGLPLRFIEESPSLSWILEARSGRSQGPYLRTPEGFLLGGLHEILDWIERAHPEPGLVPTSPVRRVCTQLLEDWIEGWLPLFADRSWKDLQAIGKHLSRSPFLLGSSAVRADWLLAAWIETEVVLARGGRRSLEACSPRLLRLGNDLLEAEFEPEFDDAVPISLLPVLERMSAGYHPFLLANQLALKDRSGEVVIDLGLGPRSLPMSAARERRRTEIATGVAALPRADREGVRRILEPVGAWHVLTLPSVLEKIDATDPRSL